MKANGIKRLNRAGFTRTAIDGLADAVADLQAWRESCMALDEEENVPECGESTNDEDRAYRCNRILHHPGNHAMLDGAKQVAEWPRITRSDYQRGADSRNAEIASLHKSYQEQLKTQNTNLQLAEANASYECAAGWKNRCLELEAKLETIRKSAAGGEGETIMGIIRDGVCNCCGRDYRCYQKTDDDVQDGCRCTSDDCPSALADNAAGGEGK